MKKKNKISSLMHVYVLFVKIQSSVAVGTKKKNNIKNECTIIEQI